MRPYNRIAAGLVSCLIPLALAAQAPQDASQARQGTLERIHVYGPSLQGNLEGDDPTRDVFVYLPPSYSDAPERRYPVVYFLHGYTVGAEAYVRMTGLPDSADAAIVNGAAQMIIVLPDAFTRYSGSLYSSSPTIGDWEGYIARDLVSYIDSNYRTIPTRASRGLAGHSMGGYGTMRIGMKRPEVYSSLYAMSSCCLMIDPERGGDAVTRFDPTTEAGEPTGGGDAGNRFANALLAQAAAWAPNPDNPPRFFDLPFKDGELQPLIHAKWLANSPLVMVDQYVPSLKRYRAIALDVGDADPLNADNHGLTAALTRLGVEHSFEEYAGTHTNRVRERFETHVVPFFSQQLELASTSTE